MILTSKIKKHLCLIILGFTSLIGYSQNDYATVFIYRPSSAYGAMAKHHVFINDEKTAVLKNGSYLIYKVYHSNKIDISVTAKAMGMGSLERTHLVLSVEKGKEYYIRMYPKIATLGLEQLGQPIVDTKFKKNRLFLADDLTAIKTETSWNETALKDLWSKNEADPIEGIYQRMGSKIGYKVAILKKDYTYKVIYLQGENSINWKEGDVKAVLTPTVNVDTFIATWKTDKTTEDVLITMTKSIFKVQLSDNSNEELYVKIYPSNKE